jgi:hypothetical protein
MKQVTESHVKTMVNKSKMLWNETDRWIRAGSEMMCKTDR